MSKPTDELMRAIGTDHWIRVPGLITCGTDTAETGRLEFVVDGRRSPRKRTEDTSTSGAKPSPGNFEDSGGEASVSSAGAVPAASTPPAVVDLNGLRVASVPLPGFALHEVKGGRAFDRVLFNVVRDINKEALDAALTDPGRGGAVPASPRPALGGQHVVSASTPARPRSGTACSSWRPVARPAGRPPSSLGARRRGAVATERGGQPVRRGEGRVRLDPAPADVLGGGGWEGGSARCEWGINEQDTAVEAGRPRAGRTRWSSR